MTEETSEPIPATATPPHTHELRYRLVPWLAAILAAVGAAATAGLVYFGHRSEETGQLVGELACQVVKLGGKPIGGATCRPKASPTPSPSSSRARGHGRPAPAPEPQVTTTVVVVPAPGSSSSRQHPRSHSSSSAKPTHRPTHSPSPKPSPSPTCVLIICLR